MLELEVTKKLNLGTAHNELQVKNSFNETGIVGIFGPSGSGKSTLLKIIAGLTSVDSGFIKFNKKVYLDQGTFLLPVQRNVGYLFQDLGLFPHMTVYENLKFSMKELNSILIESWLKKLNVYRFKDILVSKLSGGQKQKVAFIRALLNDQNLILLDEPFSAQDFESKKLMREIILSLKTTKLVIIVTHELIELKNLTENTFLVLDGRLSGENLNRYLS